MSVGILIITHNKIGKQLLETATVMLDSCPLQVQTVEVFQDSDPDTLLEQARETAKHLNDGDGLLVLTDIYGSTPSNIANRLADNNLVEVISGVNLPMLIRALNYPHLNLDQLTEKALSGGRDGIVRCTQETSESHD